MNKSADPFSGIAAFVRAAEAQSFTVAARQLGLTPSAVSKSAAKLEQEMGVRLFNRSPRLVTLTPEGEAFFVRCRDLLHDIEDTRAAVIGLRGETRGSLRIALPVSFGQYVVGPALSGFLASHPGVEVEVILTDRHADLVAERFDLAVRLGITPDSRLVEHKLAPHRFLTAASPTYLDTRGTPDVPADLARHSCLGYTMATTGQPRVWEFERADQNWRHTPRGAPRSDSAPLLMELAIGGHGLIQAPHYVLQDALDKGLLRQVLPDYRCVGLPLAIIYPQSRYLSAAKRAFVDFLKQVGGA